MRKNQKPKPKKNEWDKAQKDSLGKVFKGIPVDYALLPIKDEAQFEGQDFFENQWDVFHNAVNKTINKNHLQVRLEQANVIAAGIGSSSTQVYAKVGQEVKSTFDPELGAKPTSKIKKGSVEDLKKIQFTLKFKELLNFKKEYDDYTFVATNAIGYTAKGCAKDLDKGGKDADKTLNSQIKKKIMEYEPIPISEYNKWTQACLQLAEPSVETLYGPTLLHHLGEALTAKKVKNIVMENKMGDSIPGGASWVSFIVGSVWPEEKEKK